MAVFLSNSGTSAVISNYAPGLQIGLDKKAWTQFFSAFAQDVTKDFVIQDRFDDKIAPFSISQLDVTKIQFNEPEVRLLTEESSEVFTGEYVRALYTTNNLVFNASFKLSVVEGGSTVSTDVVASYQKGKGSVSIALILTNNGQYHAQAVSPIGSGGDITFTSSNQQFPNTKLKQFQDLFKGKVSQDVIQAVVRHIYDLIGFNNVRALNKTFNHVEYPISPLGIADYRAVDRVLSINNTTAIFSYDGDVTPNNRRSSWNVARHEPITPPGQNPLEVVLDTFLLNTRLRTAQIGLDGIKQFQFTVGDFKSSWPALAKKYPADRRVEVAAFVAPEQNGSFNEYIVRYDSTRQRNVASVKTEVEVWVSVYTTGDFPYPVPVLKLNVISHVDTDFKVAPYTSIDPEREGESPLSFAITQKQPPYSSPEYQYDLVQVDEALPLDFEYFTQNFLRVWYDANIMNPYLDEVAYVPIPIPLPAGFAPKAPFVVEVSKADYIYIQSDISYVKPAI